MDNKNKSLMNRILKSPKVMLFISIALAFIADFVATIMLFKGGYELQYLIFPLLILIFDILFFVLSIFSNYRFKYSILQMVTYLILVFCGVGAVTILFATRSNHIVMTILSCVLWIGVHALGLATVLTNSLHASKISKKPKKVIPFISVALLTTMVVFFSATVCHNGFFGQGYIEEARTLVYEYSEDDEGYVVKSTLKGRGNTAIIPTEFNGKDVVAVDCDIFVDDNLRAVRFEKGNSDIKFKNVDALDKLNSDKEMTLYAEKEDIDNIKNTLYASSFDNTKKNAILKLTNTFYPAQLSEDEVYITFEYSIESYDIANEVVFKTWFGQRGDKFDITFDDQVPYANYIDTNNPNHLDWNYKNTNKHIMNPLLNEEGENINGLEINKSIKNIQVSFEKIYAVSIEDDNDEKYEIDDQYRYTNLDSSNLEYKYVLESTANDLINNVPLREGFKLAWFYEGNTFTDLRELILEEGNSSVVSINPVWSLNNPVINNVYTNDQNNSFIYGDTVVLNADVSDIVDGIEFNYVWTCNSKSYETNNKELTNVLPSQSGTYTLTVTAYSDDITSLTSVSKQTIDINIDKRTLDFDWTLPSNLVYNGENKEILCNHDASQVINSDEITYSITDVIVHNAGNYQFEVELTGECAELYKVNSSDKSISFEIEQRVVSLIWEETNFVYNGLKQVPEVEVTGLISGDSCSVIVSVVGGTNAGTYIARPKLGNNNYKLPDENTKEYTISQKVITASVTPGGGTYNENIVATTASLNGVVEGENVLISYTYIGTAHDSTYYNGSVMPTKAGRYIVRVTISDTNYSLEETERDFIIEKAVVEVPTIQSKTYTGKALTASVSSNLYRITSNASNAINVGDYNIQVTLTDAYNYEWENSSDATIEVVFTITQATNSWKKNPSITGWTYGDEAREPNYEAKFGNEDVTIDYRLATSTSYTSVVPTNAGDYYVRIRVEGTNNYTGLLEEKSFTIAKAVVEVPIINSVYYTGQVQTATIDNPNNLYIVVSNAGGTSVGDYDVILELKDSNNYTWEDSSESTIILTFKIKQALNGWSKNPSIEDSEYGEDLSVNYEAQFGDVIVEYRPYGTDVAYTTGLPTQAGKYEVRFRVDETSNYRGLMATRELTISPKEVSVEFTDGSGTYGGTITGTTVTLNDLVYGDDPTITITYKDNDGYESTEVPTEAGKYEVIVTISDPNYTLKNNTSTFTIAQAINDWLENPSIEGWTYGDTAKTPNYDAEFGDVIVEYRPENGTDADYTTEVPEEAGVYTVRFTVEGTKNYTGLSYTTTFTISPREVGVVFNNGSGTYGGTITGTTVTLNDLVYGDNPTITITYSGNGYESTEVPTEAGTYTVTVTTKDPNYTLKNNTSTFTIAQATNSWVEEPSGEFLADYGEDLNINYEAKFGNESAIIEYRPTSSTYANIETEIPSFNPDSDYIEGLPTEAGSYEIRIRIEATDNYTGLSYTFSIWISPATNSWVEEPSIEDSVYGENLNINYEAKFGTVKVEYRPVDGTEEDYTTEVPEEAGEYVARFTVKETDNYTGLVKELTFTITDDSQN